MNKTKGTFITLALLLTIVATPLSAKALTTSDLQAQIQNLMQILTQLQQQVAQQHTTGQTNVDTSSTPRPVPCTAPRLRRSLWLGLRGSDVSELQRYLKREGYYRYSQITGYYGPATLRAVQAFQRVRGIVSYGTPDTTGYGVVGKKTRGKMRCVGVSVLDLRVL